ncbi:hypothetical protein [Asanoa siamensis]|uniref:NIPSNAP protein n=1 Tax=Asanoa siamensis TaxID=926357 RepID=A0ABQ4CMY2_9ACTN|nr:hypothetical protein [Asanoa siamensis]GIF72649.1 hypothetical protein Asi02nite_21670 [Asanoa siamensis]
MNEDDFWLRLEYRVSAEFRGFTDKDLRQFWCDGFVPEEYDLLAERPCIRGMAWCGPTGQDTWTFVLFLNPTVRHRDEIDWATLLPSDESTGWLTPDPTSRSLTIDQSISTAHDQ